MFEAFELFDEYSTEKDDVFREKEGTIYLFSCCNMTCTRAVPGFKRILFLVYVFPTVENSVSTGAEEAGIARIWRANFAIIGN